MIIDIILVLTAVVLVITALNGDYRAIRAGSPRFRPPVHMALALVVLLGTETTGTIALVSDGNEILEVIRIFVNTCGIIVLYQLRGMVTKPADVP